MKRKIAMILLAVCFLCIFILAEYMTYTDHNLIEKKEKAKFCLYTTVNKYDDGEVEICHGIIYKAIYYNRDCFNAISFYKLYEDDISPTLDACKKIEN